jgi:BCD family chlorophyll transporter-like MFS transporter
VGLQNTLFVVCVNGMQEQRFSVFRTIKIGLFQVGSTFTDILVSGVWNRVMISDLNIGSTPVALLSALRFLLAPLSIWAGYRSDTTKLWGSHRLSYIWLGRILMLLALPFLPFTTVMLAEDPFSWLAWMLLTFSFILYGIGNLVSGSPYLALVRDGAPPAKQGMAISIVQIMLIGSFSFVPALYSLMMGTYSPEQFWRIVLIGMGVAAFFWTIPLFGEEPRTYSPAEKPAPFRGMLASTWADPRARLFFVYLGLGAICSFAQDSILEPFGADIFGYDIRQTTRFNAYWGVGVLVGMIGTVAITRRRTPSEQKPVAIIGLLLTAVPFFFLTTIAVTREEWMLIPTLIAFGLGMGIYTMGTMSILAAMTVDKQAGAYLGLWSMAQLLFRGVGVALGGFLRDLALRLTSSVGFAYGVVFLLEGIGLLACILLLWRLDIKGFVSSHNEQSSESALNLADL